MSNPDLDTLRRALIGKTVVSVENLKLSEGLFRILLDDGTSADVYGTELGYWVQVRQDDVLHFENITDLLWELASPSGVSLEIDTSTVELRWPDPETFQCVLRGYLDTRERLGVIRHPELMALADDEDAWLAKHEELLKEIPMGDPYEGIYSCRIPMDSEDPRAAILRAMDKPTYDELVGLLLRPLEE